MKDQKEIQIALKIWNLTNKLGDLLWDRYDKEFLEIYLRELENTKIPFIISSCCKHKHNGGSRHEEINPGAKRSVGING